MKKLIYTLLAFATVCFSCVQDVDDVYDKPVAQRVEEAVQEYHDLLVSSEHGWLMEYYPHSSQIYGGFNYIMKFKEGDKVTISTDALGNRRKRKRAFFLLRRISDRPLTLTLIIACSIISLIRIYPEEQERAKGMRVIMNFFCARILRMRLSFEGRKRRI